MKFLELISYMMDLKKKFLEVVYINYFKIRKIKIILNNSKVWLVG